MSDRAGGLRGVFPARGGPWLAAICVVLLAGCGGAHPTSTHRRAAVAARHPSPPARPQPQPHPQQHRKHRPPLGSLPQTNALPSASTATFRQEMRALWHGVQSDSVTAALPAFFPERAYLQVKALPDPAADWQTRLVGGFQLDLGAAHNLLAGAGGAASLVGVNVPMSFAHWVTPGTCYNRVGYWEVPNSRVVYRQGGAERSFGIASMISWRGVWYVVHLGAVLRGAAGGVVDDPSSGPGVSVNSGTC